MGEYECAISIWMLLINLIFFIVQSLAYSTVYYIGRHSFLLTFGVFMIEICIWICIVEANDVISMVHSLQISCCVMCQSLFVGSIYITHVHDSDVKSVIIRLVILLACNFVFSFMMHLASCLDDAFKVRLKRLHYIKFKIVWWFSYVYIAIIAPLILITSIVFSVRNSSVHTHIDVFVGFLSSVVCVLSGIVMLCCQNYNIENCKYDCTIALTIIQVASAVAFIASTVTNMVMLIIINSSYLIIIGSFTLVFVANIILLVGMLLLRDLISCCSICFLRRSPAAVNEVEVEA
jgi:hypothetical protein